MKFNNKKIQEFPLEKRKRKISPIICQKNSEISPGKKPLVPSSPPQNILGSTWCGLWDVPDFWNVLYWGTYTRIPWDFHGPKRQNIYKTQETYMGWSFQQKFVAKWKTIPRQRKESVDHFWIELLVARQPWSSGLLQPCSKSAGVSLCSNCAIAAKLVVCEWLPYLIVPRESEPQWTSTHQPNRARWMMMMVCGLETHL